ncbi:hypothetical protein KCU85_g3661, partial [Aureobasidium melanogenum]
MAYSLNPRPAVTLPHGGFFSAFAEDKIAAPPSAVYKALLDTSKYGQWNNFVTKVTIDKQPESGSAPQDTQLKKDMVMTFTVRMSATMTTHSKELVTQIDDCPTDSAPGHITCIRWIMANKESFAPKFIIAAERVNEIEDLGDGTCIYRSWETFGGLAARIVKWKFGHSLQKNFEDWVAGLQRYVEEEEKKKMERKAAVELAA